MARLEFSAYELIELIYANDMMPNQIVAVDVQGNTINAKVSTGLPFPKTIDLATTFTKYINGVLFFRIHTSWVVDKILHVIPLPAQRYININFPNLEIYLQKIIREKMHKLEIESITFLNGHLTVYTHNR